MNEDILNGEDEFTELYDAQVPRVDLVGKAANGVPQFLLMKSDQDTLMSPDDVRALLGDEEPVEKASEETVTVTGSPSSIARMIHQAAIRKADPAAPAQHPIHTEEAVVAKETEQVTKADDDIADAAVEVADIIPDAPGGGTAESVPGSPDWEQLDADTAGNAIGILGRVRAALEWLATREATEAVTGGDEGDADNAFDLADAACQIDCLIRRLGGFAAGEQLEAGVADEVEAVTKAAAAVAVPLGEIETQVAICKAGRVLSAQNEQRIKSASDALAEVLATLPAPVTDDGQPVAKSDESKEATVANESEQPPAVVDDTVTKAADTDTPTDAPAETAQVEQVEKAKGDPQVAVYTADGTLVGVVDQADISPIAAPAAPDGGDAQSTDDASDDAGDQPAETPPAAEQAPPAADDTAAATIPGTDTVAAPAPTPDDTDDVQKSDSHAELATLLKEALTPVTEKLSQYGELGDVVKGLQEQVEHLAALPDDRKSPIMNGATGVPGIASRDGADVSDPYAELRKAAADETASPEDRLAAMNALAYAAIRDRFKPITG